MLRPAPLCLGHQAEEDEEVDVGGPDQVPPHLDQAHLLLPVRQPGRPLPLPRHPHEVPWTLN